MHSGDVLQSSITFFFIFFLQFLLYDIRIVDLTSRCKLLVFAFILQQSRSLQSHLHLYPPVWLRDMDPISSSHKGSGGLPHAVSKASLASGGGTRSLMSKPVIELLTLTRPNTCYCKGNSGGLGM